MFINQKEILSASNNGLDVFKYYFPQLVLKKHFKARDEKDSSAVVSEYKEQYWFKDFGSGDKAMNCISFVMHREGLEYYNALKYISEVILNKAVEPGSFQGYKFKAEIKSRPATSKDKIGTYSWVKKDKPSTGDLQSIGRYVTAETLKKFNCFALKSYTMVSKDKGVLTFSSHKDFPIFLFDYGDFWKIYKPFEPDKKYRFVWYDPNNKKPKDFIFGFDQIKSIPEEESEFWLPVTIDENGNDVYGYSPPEYKPKAKVKKIFRCSGESDALNLASLGRHVYWLNSETDTMSGAQFKRIDELCETHYQILDIDETGRREAYKRGLAHINLQTVNLPDYLTKNLDWRGNQCKDVKDFISTQGHNLEDTKDRFSVLVNQALSMKFWSKSKDNNYTISTEDLYYFLNANEFYRVETPYHKNNDYCYARLDGKVVEMIKIDDIIARIKRFIKDWIKSKGLKDQKSILNKLNGSRQITEPELKVNLCIRDFNFKNCDEKTEYLHFSNTSLKITADKLEKVKHDKVPHFILGHLGLANGRVITHILDRELNFINDKPAVQVEATAEYKTILKLVKSAKTEKERNIANAELTQFNDFDKFTVTINDKDFPFATYLQDLSYIYWRDVEETGKTLSEDQKKEQNLLLVNLMFNLGYQIAEYKTKAKPWFSYVMDYKLTKIGQAHGGSGKSIFTSTVETVRPTFSVDARRSDIIKDSKIMYDGFTRFHNNVRIKDIEENTPFNPFYNDITDDRFINGKYVTPHYVDFADSGKMIADSNFEPVKINSAMMRRLLFSLVSDYYHEVDKYSNSVYKENRTPFTKFGIEFFKGFSNEQMQKLDLFLAYCVQLYQRYPKVEPPMGRIIERISRKKMDYGTGGSEAFYQWAEGYFRFLKEPNPDKWEGGDSSDAGYFNTYIIRHRAFENFKNSDLVDEITMRKYKANWFKDALGDYCKMKGYELNPENMCNGDLSLRKINKSSKLWTEGKTREVFFIRADFNPDLTEDYDELPERDFVPIDKDDKTPF